VIGLSPGIRDDLDYLDYHSSQEASFLVPATILAVAQIFYLTVMVFVLLYLRVNAIKILTMYLVWFFFTQPSACYFVIFCSIGSGDFICELGVARWKPDKSIFRFLFYFLFFISYSLSLLWLNLSYLSSLEESSNHDYVTIIGPVAVGIQLLLTLSSAFCVLRRSDL